MNIEQIKNEIDALENSPLTSENARDLASLYIIKAEYEKGKYSADNAVYVHSGVSKELDDIFPSYYKYVDSKKEYQLGKINDDFLVHSFNLLCQEVDEFLSALYASTDMVKERKSFKNMIKKMFEKIC